MVDLPAQIHGDDLFGLGVIKLLQQGHNHRVATELVLLPVLTGFAFFAGATAALAARLALRSAVLVCVLGAATS